MNEAFKKESVRHEVTLRSGGVVTLIIESNDSQFAYTQQPREIMLKNENGACVTIEFDDEVLTREVFKLLQSAKEIS